MKQLDGNPNASLKNTVYYRQDYLDEFERIWEKQATFHKELTPGLKHEIRDIIIFYQRNLKSQKSLISICQFERTEITIEINGTRKTKTVGRRVCPKSSPLFQEFKIWQTLNNLIVENIETGEKFPLSLEEKEQLFKELNVHEKLKKNEILKLLYNNHRQLDLNYKEIEGNRTLSKLLDACSSIITALGYNEHKFSKMSCEEIYCTINRCFKEHNIKSDYLHFDSAAKSIEQEPMFKLWHLLYSYTDDKSKSGNESLIKKICTITNMNEECASLLANITFDQDYSSLSSKAIGKILPHLKEGNKYDVACTYAGYNHSHSQTSDELKNKTYKETLEQMPHNSLRNPVVEKILNQMINVVNAVTEEYGKPDEIRIELARELKSSAKEREEATNAINKANKEHEEIKDTLRREFNIKNPGRNDIIKYKLYTELKNNGYKTLYSNTYIPQEELFSQRFNVEHIIPQARLFDDSYSNKTLEAMHINIEKGSKTAYDYIQSKYGEEKAKEYKTLIEHLYKTNQISKTKRDKLLMQGQDIPSDFINRDLRDTQYIARKAREILEQIVPHVVATTGKITDRLRQDWGLIDTMQELNWEKYHRRGLTETITNREDKPIKRIKDWTKRNDHRHHAMDAIVIAFTKHNIIQYLNNLNARSDKSSNIYAIEQKELERSNHRKLRFKEPFENFREAAKLQLERILISIKSKSKVITKNTNKTKTSNRKLNHKQQLTPRGQLHNETIYGSIQRYNTYEKSVGSKFTAEDIKKIADKRYREALLERLHENGNDAKKAFTGRNNLDKNPIYLDNGTTVPSTVKLVELKKTYTVRKPIDNKLKIDKVVDKRIKEILIERLKQYNNDATAAFSNLDESPIWLNKEKGIKIKRVTILENQNEPIALHDKRDHHGRLITNDKGKPQPSDYVNSANNHHVAIYTDHEGKYQENIVSFFAATARAINQQPIIDREYKASEGWQFCFTMKQNEYFVFPNKATGFDPQETDLLNPENFHLISPNLYRVQKLSSKNYHFRHHLETKVDDIKELKDITWKRITSLKDLEGIVKVRINHIGKIVHIGE